MSTAFDRFAHGEDRLSALLKALPTFEVPEHMTDAFLRAACQAQSEYSASSTSTLLFEPSPAMEAQFLREVSRIQADQAPREEAVLAQIAAGQSAESVLGGRVARETAMWLEARQATKAFERAQALSTAAPAAKHGWRQWLSLRDLGLAASALVITLVAGQWFLREPNVAPQRELALSPTATKPEPQPPQNETAPAPAATAIAPRTLIAGEERSMLSEADRAFESAAEKKQIESILPKQNGASPAKNEISTVAKAPASPSPIAETESAETTRRAAGTMADAKQANAHTDLSASEPRVPESSDSASYAAKERVRPLARRMAIAAASAPMAETMAAPAASDASTSPTQKRAFGSTLAEDPSALRDRLGPLKSGTLVRIRSAAPLGLQDWAATLQETLPPGTTLEMETSEHVRGDTLEIEVFPPSR